MSNMFGNFWPKLWAEFGLCDKTRRTRMLMLLNVHPKIPFLIKLVFVNCFDSIKMSKRLKKCY